MPVVITKCSVVLAGYTTPIVNNGGSARNRTLVYYSTAACQSTACNTSIVTAEFSAATYLTVCSRLRVRTGYASCRRSTIVSECLRITPTALSRDVVTSTHFRIARCSTAHFSIMNGYVVATTTLRAPGCN